VSQTGQQVFLPGRFVTESMQEGDDITVFIYLDTDDRPIATTEQPLVKVGECAFLTVSDVNKFGAF